MKRFFYKNSEGFTLIELLVVIAIIGILATVITVSLSNARQKARDTRRVSDTRQVQDAAQMYFEASGSYPSVLTQTVPVYLVGVPKDPINAGVNVYTYAVSPSGCDGSQLNPCLDYVFHAILENFNDTLNNGLSGTVINQNCNHAAAPWNYCVGP